MGGCSMLKLSLKEFLFGSKRGIASSELSWCIMGLAQRVVIYHRTVPIKMTSIGGERRSTAAAESAAKEVGSQSG